MVLGSDVLALPNTQPIRLSSEWNLCSAVQNKQEPFNLVLLRLKIIMGCQNFYHLHFFEMCMFTPYNSSTICKALGVPSGRIID